jgi:hypothetical protein
MLLAVPAAAASAAAASARSPAAVMVAAVTVIAAAVAARSLKQLSPVVTGPSAFKFQGAEGVCDVLNGVTEAVREVIAGVDAPLVAGHGMLHIFDPSKQEGTGNRKMNRQASCMTHPCEPSYGCHCHSCF